MADHFSSKKEIRELFLESRQNLSQKFVEKKSREIQKRILNTSEFQKAEVIHTYISIAQNNEVNTLPIIETCFEQGKKVVVPKIAGDGMMDHIEIFSFDELEINNWGVPEPKGGNTFPIDDLGLIIVPMVAGDRYKNRLGYGEGFYDRFLKECSATKIGLLFDCQLFENKLPVESYDIPLDILTTETKQIE